jgi:GT2 family glycosyltransferase
MGLPHVAVLLLNWNGWRDTIECLESLFRLDYPRLTLIVCDNASSDGSPEKIRSWADGTWVPELSADPRLEHLSSPPARKPIRLVEHSRAEAEVGGAENSEAPLILIHNGGNLGFAGGNNVGLRYLARRPDIEYVWVLNNDIVVAPDSLRKLVQSAEAIPHVGGVGATLFEYRKPSIVQAAGGGVFSRWALYPRPARSRRGRQIGSSGGFDGLDFVSGGCMLSPVAQLARVGFIDESYFLYGEDVDYSVRVRQAGLKLAYVPAAHVWHKGGGSAGYGNAKHDYYTVRNALVLVHKYYPRLMPIAVAYTIYRCVIAKLFRGERDRLTAVYRAWKDFRNGVVGPYAP